MPVGQNERDVVPAQAGTHTPRPRVSRSGQRLPLQQTTGIMVPAFAGTTRESISHSRDDAAPSRHATSGRELFCNLGEHADGGFAGHCHLAVAGLQQRGRGRALADGLGNGDPDQHRGVGNAV